ncbi:MAG: AEC family transporter [Clostridiales bacterium]|nr:AEC family transporter [Clostridiales bacterium]
MWEVFNQILSLFLIILVGFYGRKRSIIDDTLTNGLSRMLLEITTPLLIISSFNYDVNSSLAKNTIKAFIYGILIFIITPFMVKPLLTKIEKGKRNILQFAIVFSNCGFMGIPITAAVLGEEAVIYASIFNMCFNLFIWTYGVTLFTDAASFKEAKKLLKNPGIIAVFIGLLLTVFSVKLPIVLYNTISLVGHLTTPISMIIIGSLLASIDFKAVIKDKTIYYGAFIKLIIIPAVLYGISLLISDNSLVMRTYVLIQAMPAGATTSLFAERFNKEKEYSAFVVSFSTLLSIITIPMIIALLL